MFQKGVHEADSRRIGGGKDSVRKGVHPKQPFSRPAPRLIRQAFVQKKRLFNRKTGVPQRLFHADTPFKRRAVQPAGGNIGNPLTAVLD